MDSATLVGPDMVVGEKLLEALDNAGISANVALLGTTSDYEDWQLILSSPDLDQESPRDAISQVLSALRKKYGHTVIPEFLIVRQKDPFVRELRKRYAKSGDVRGARLGYQSMGERSLESGYVLRIR